MDPVALVAGGREDVPQRCPQPQRAVADGQDRGAHAAAAQVAQPLGPAVGGLAFAISDGDQLLGAVGAHAHQHQTAQAGLLQPHPEVDPISPDGHVVAVGQLPAAEGLVLGLPGGDQAGDRRR